MAGNLLLEDGNNKIMIRKRSKKTISAPHDAFTVSISDLMAGLLSIFILALTYFMLNLTQVTQQYTGNTEKRNQILQNIQMKMNERGVKVTIDSKQGVLRIPESVLFDQGEADVKAEGQQAVVVLSQVLYEVLTEEEYRNSVETIFIEGHTDNVPIENNRFHSNWELSTQRAINTWNLMRLDQPDLNKLINPNGQPLFSCSGYADTRPVIDDGYDESSEEGRQANRRIDIRFTMIPPSNTAKDDN